MAAKSRTIETYEALRQRLLDGVYPPQKKLRIDQISKEMEVSPGAVREALARLTSDGLVVSEPQRGFVTAPISVADLTDLTSVRVEIELNCLRRSIRIGNLEWEGKIKSIWHQLERTPPRSETNPTAFNPRWSDLHAAFHDSLISACDSKWRLKLRDQMFTQAERYRRLLLPYTKIQRDPHEEHKSIAEAVLARDADLACDLLAQHLNKTADILLSSDAPFSDVPRKPAQATEDVSKENQ
jgi:DNA-binding GntR family transcriptional regulator